jgi:cholesterol transport system auxiliary component
MGADRTVKRCASLALAFILSGCAALSSAPPPSTFDLRAPAAFSGALGRSAAQLVVMTPRAVGPYASERIVVRPDPIQIAFFPGAQWSDQLPVLVRSRIARSFENADRIKAVGQEGDGLKSEYILVTEIRSFELVAATGLARIALFMKLIDDRTGEVLASRLFEGAAPVPGETPEAVVAGLDAAFDTVLREIVAWTVGRI